MTALNGSPHGHTESGLAYVQAAQYAADIALVGQIAAADPRLQATRPEFHTRLGHLWVEVEGTQWEAHAWRAATRGRILPSRVDRNGVRHQLVFDGRIYVDVIDDPRKRGA